MDILIRAIVLGLVASILALVLKRGSGEIGLLLAISASALILTLGIGLIGEVIAFGRSLGEAAGIAPGLISPVMKTTAIGLLTKVASDICKDAGQSAIAGTVELMGTISALYIALPLMQSVFSMIGRLL